MALYFVGSLLWGKHFLPCVLSPLLFVANKIDQSATIWSDLLFVNLYPPWIQLKCCWLDINQDRGRSRGAHPARAPPPLKLEEILFFCVKSWFFTWNTPKFSCLTSLSTIILNVPPPTLISNPGSTPTTVNQSISHKISKILWN